MNFAARFGYKTSGSGSGYNDGCGMEEGTQACTGTAADTRGFGKSVTRRAGGEHNCHHIRADRIRIDLRRTRDEGEAGHQFLPRRLRDTGMN